MFLRQKYPFQEGSLKCISLPLKSKGCFSSESMVSMAVLYFKRNQKLCTGKDSALCQRVFALVLLPLWGFYQTLGCRRFWPVQTSSSVTFVWYQCWGLPRFKKYHRLLNSSCSKFFFRPTKSQHYIYHLFFMLMDCNGNFYEALFMFGSSWVIRFHTNLWGPCQLSPGSVIKAKWRPKKY